MAFITSGQNSSSGYAASPLTISSVACGTAANTVIVGVLIGDSGLPNNITGMTVNGSSTGVVAGTENTYGSDDKQRWFRWSGTGPGTVNIAFQWTGDISAASGFVWVWDSTDAFENVVDHGAAGGTTTTPNLTVTSATGDLAVAFFVHSEEAESVTGAGGTIRGDVAAGTFRAFALEEPGAASVNVDGTTSGSIFPLGRLGLSLSQAAAGGLKKLPVLLGGGFPSLTGGTT